MNKMPMRFEQAASSSEKGRRRAVSSEYDTTFDRTILVKDEQQKNQSGPDRNYYL